MTDLSTSAPRPVATLAPSRRVGGIGGIVFVVAVIAQNVIRSSMPAMDASTRDVIAFYGSHRGAGFVLAVLFPIGALGLAAFAGGMYPLLGTTETRGPATAGFVGLTGVVALFATTHATDMALASYIHRGTPDPGAVSVLWSLHNAVFAALLVVLGVALAGTSAAASGAGLVGRRWKEVGGLGGLALLATGAAGPSLLDGSPVMALGLIGFVVWLVFLTVASVGLLREPSAVTAAPG